MSELLPLSPDLLRAAAETDNAADAERQAVTNLLFEGWGASEPRAGSVWMASSNGAMVRKTTRYTLVAEANRSTLSVLVRSTHSVPRSQLGAVTSSLNDFHRDGLGLRAHLGVPMHEEAPVVGDWQVPLASGVTESQLVEFLRFASAAAEALADHVDEVLRLLGCEGDTDIDDDMADSATAALASADARWRTQLEELAAQPAPTEGSARRLAEQLSRHADAYRAGFLQAAGLQEQVVEAVVEAYETQKSDYEMTEWLPRTRLMQIAMGVLASRLALDDEGVIRTMATLQRLASD